MSLCYKIVDSDQAVRQLKQPWDDLLSQTSSPSVFSTWEWAYTWWLCFKKDRKLHIICVWDGDNRLVGIAPLFQEFQKVLPGIKSAALNFLGSKIGGADYLDFIISPALREPVIQMIFQALKEESEWDRLVLTDVLEDSPNILALKELAQQAGYRTIDRPLHRCPYIVINESWEEYHNSLEKHTRYNLRRYRNALSRKFASVSLEALNDFADIDFYLEKLLKLKEKSWSITGKKGLNLPPEWVKFHGQLARAFSQRGWPRLFYLKVNNEIVSLWYGFSYGSKYWYLNAAYDVDFPRVFGLGKLLLSETIKAAFKEGSREYDFLRGPEPYKYEWANAERTTRSITLLKRTPAAAIWAWRNAIEDDCRRWLKRFLPAPLFEKLKTLRR